MNSGVTRRSGGRPTAQAAAALETSILDHATAAFLADGYAATTIEAIARTCGVAKRTIYTRWNGKPVLFRAVLDRLMARWLSIAGDWAIVESLETTLNEAAIQILQVALTPEAVALHRLLIAESARFPELPVMMAEARAHEGMSRIASVAGPGHGQRRIAAQGHSLRGGTVLSPVAGRSAATCAWAWGARWTSSRSRRGGKNAVRLFISGVKS